MPEAESITGIDIDAAAAAVGVAVQGFFVLFFVISPIAGGVMHRQIKRRSTLILATMLALLAFNGLWVGLTYLLQQRGTWSAAQILAVSLAFALGSAVILFYGALAVFAEPEKPHEDVDRFEESDLSFQSKRMERLKKRDKR